MSLVTSRQMLSDARAGGYAVGAFNVENLEMVKAVIRAAAETSSPVILQTTPAIVEYIGLDTCVAMVTAEAKRVSVPVCLHLDYGKTFDLAVSAIRDGYTSLMIDGSGMSFEDSVILTKRIVAVAHPFGLGVEADIGRIGRKEELAESEEDASTDPFQAAQFTARTRVDFLAVTIGTTPGICERTPNLDIERLSQIHEKIMIPLVLHGASGLSGEKVRECVTAGICKVNFATEVRMAYVDAIKTFLSENPETDVPMKIGVAGMEAVTALVMDRMKDCGCCGKG